MKRYEKFVYEDEKKGIKYEKTALKGSFFEFSEGTSGELIIKVKAVQPKKVVNTTKRDVTTKTVQPSTCNYKNPPIPKGYKHIYGKWNNGFVIERETDRSQFVWVPVGSLNANGTLDGVSFNEKFGRRNYRNVEFSEGKYQEPLTGQLALQVESVKKYGGFYISRYNISKSSKGKPQSVKGVMPWTNINFNGAKKIASTIEDNEAVKSHLTYGAEYDSVLEWFIKSNMITHYDLGKKHGPGGFYAEGIKDQVHKTGECEYDSNNKIYDFGKNVNEWTQEQYDSCYRVCRVRKDTSTFTTGIRASGQTKYKDMLTGFRAALYIK